MSIVSTTPVQSPTPEINALTRDVTDPSDAHVACIIAKVDALAMSGPADALIEPLRQRLRILRSPRPLHFGRLLFHPLDPLIVPAARWQPGHSTIPRWALMPMVELVRQALGSDLREIKAEIAGRTDADTNLIERLGRTLWPTAAQVLAVAERPESWKATALGDEAYQPLACNVAALLRQTVPLDLLCAETATGLLPPNAERIAIMLRDIAATMPDALPMLIVLMLLRLPTAVASMRPDQGGLEPARIQTAIDQATDQVLQQLDTDEGMEAQIAAGTLADAGTTVARIATLLEQLDTRLRKPQRREQLRALRHRLDAGCKARFALDFPEEFLTPLQNLRPFPDPLAIRDLETAARGLRILGIEARVVGSGPTYDFWLRKATEAVKDKAMLDRLTQVDQVRLVEILSGPDAALELAHDCVERPVPAT